jgi:hypothetical protein
MALLKQIPKKVKLAKFQNKGWFLFCPVYIGKKSSLCPDLVERNCVPEWVWSAALTLFDFNCTVMCWLNPHFEPMFPILITGELN